jgi:hypothetical protein
MKKSPAHTVPWKNETFRRNTLITLFLLALAYFCYQAISKVLYTKSYARLIDAEEYSGEATVTVPLAKEILFEESSFEDALAIRQQLADQSGLLEAPYQKTRATFARVDPAKPWLSTARLYYYGKKAPAPSLPKGATAASSAILNPLLLARAEFWGLSIWGPRNLVWNKRRNSLAKLLAAGVPLRPRMSGLIYEPGNSLATVTYHVSEFLFQTEPYLSRPLGKQQITFALQLQNAYDLGFRSFELDLEKSINIANSKQPPTPLPIEDYFGAIKSSWNPELVFNHVSASTPQYDWIEVKDLPATAIIKLWYDDDIKDRPVPHNYNFVMRFE